MWHFSDKEREILREALENYLDAASEHATNLEVHGEYEEGELYNVCEDIRVTEEILKRLKCKNPSDVVE